MSGYDQIRTVTRLSTALLLAVFSGVVGVLYDNRVLVAAFEALAALLLLSWLYVRLGAAAVTVTRVLPPRAAEDDPVPVTLKVRTRSWLPLLYLEVHDWFAPDFLPMKRLLLPFLGPEPVELTYEGRCEQGRGRFEVGPAEVVVTDPLGFFRRAVPAAGTGEILVSPRPFPVHGLDLREEQSRMPVSSPEAARAGQAATFLGTREYRYGDNTRHIHWPSTVRWGRLVLKEFETDTNLDLTIFLDASQAALRGLGRGSTLEAAVRIAASVGDHALARLYSVRLIADDGAPVVLPARPGAAQRAALLETLALLKATGKTSYGQLVTRGLRLVPDGSVVLLILPGVEPPDDRFVEILGAFRRRAIRVVPVVLDAASFAAMDSGQGRGTAAALVAALENLGLEPRVIRAGQDLAASFAGRTAR